MARSLEPRFQDSASDRAGHVATVRGGVGVVALDEDRESDLRVVGGRKPMAHAFARLPSPVSAVPVLAATATFGSAIVVPVP